VLDALSLLIVAAGLLSAGLLLFIKDYLMVDVTALNAQVDTSLKVMAEAVDTLRDNVQALKVAQVTGDAEGVAAATARLKTGTDTLAAAVEAARAAAR